MNDSIKDGESNVQSRETEPWQTRFQFPLYKLFLVMGAYAMSFALYGSNEASQIIVASWVGTAWGAWILAVRTRSDLLRSLIAAIGASVGGFMAVPAIVGHVNDPWLVIFAAVVPTLGAFVFAGTSRIVIKREEQQ
jgi:hypothetical protein